MVDDESNYIVKDLPTNIRQLLKSTNSFAKTAYVLGSAGIVATANFLWPMLDFRQDD